MRALTAPFFTGLSAGAGGFFRALSRVLVILVELIR